MDYLEYNKKYWDERVSIHLKSGLYSLEEFKNGKNKLHSLEREELGDITGKSVLHLQCHFGMDTLSLKMLGASEVTGADFSGEAIKTARELSRETGIEADFIESDLYLLSEKLHKKFDIVYTSYGVLAWLPDIKRWAETVSHFVKPGGFFYIAEIHPLSYIFDNEAPGINNLAVRYPYFAVREPIEFNESGSYADKDAVTLNNRTYEWAHSMSDIIMSLLNAGLKLEFFHEHAFTVWDHFPFMKLDENGYRRLEGDPIPLLFSLKAVK